MKPKQRLMTRDEFTRWVGQNTVKVFARPPYRLEPCACRDVNCHGWRFLGVIDRPRHTTGVTAAPRRELHLAPLDHECAGRTPRASDPLVSQTSETRSAHGVA